ncbi:MAG TPA: CARDB domain-containing protein [Verrucomicrobiota bacterium]|nr:CARDB domain-containing protein [Verrucomicrobiota bacterium]
MTLPHTTASLPGTYFIVAVVDQQKVIAESDENNNLRSQPIALTLPPLPDLQVTQVQGPANVSPGVPFVLQWATTNSGAAAAVGDWSETIFLATNAAGTGNLLELATLPRSGGLLSGGFVSHTQAVVVPVTGPAGNFWFAVLTDSRDQVREVQEANNLSVATNQISVPATLQLQLSAAQVAEGASQPLLGTVTRNGARTAPLTVTLEHGRPDKLIVPAQVTIPAGAAAATFNLITLRDGIADGDQLVTLQATATGHASGSANLLVVDVDLPQLTLQFSTNQVVKGSTVAGTVTREGGTNQSVEVSFSTAATSRLMLPLTLTIPAGQFSASFAALAIDNTFVEAAQSVTATAAAEGYQPGSADLTILDGRWPVVTLAIVPPVFAEGAGAQAAQATLTRWPVSPRPLVVDLESSNTNAVRVPRQVTIPANETNLTFNVAAVDNSTVDGEKSVTVQSWFLASASNVRLAEGVPAQVTVTDDDGPTLSVSFNRGVVTEGQSPAAVGTITRNTGTQTSLVVQLVSSDLTELTVPATVTLPVGASSASFNVTSVDDGVTDGNQLVTVTASAPGFTSGSGQITVTDVNLPDLVIGSVTAPASATTETYVSLGWQLLNQGIVAMPSNAIVQRIWLSTNQLIGPHNVLVGQAGFNGPLPAGAAIGQSISVRMPQAAGQYWVIVQADAMDGAVELDENNNFRIASAPMVVGAAYDAVVQTSLEAAPAGTPVPLSGSAFLPGHPGSKLPFVLVNISVRVRGTTRVISALTDAAGNFSTTWQPLAGEAGFYEIAASHPGISQPAVQDSFYLLGMKATPAQPSVRLSEGSSVAQTLQLQNLADVPLSELTVAVTNVPANLVVTAGLQTNYLAGEASVELNYEIAATDASFTSGILGLRITSVEGAVLEVPIRVTIDPLVPRLVAYPGSLLGGMKRGAQRIVSFQIVNAGGLETGPLTLSLPPIAWMSLATPNPLPSLAPGQTNTVTLQLNPPEDLPLQMHNGNLAINGTGTGLSVPFAFRALSEAKGALQVMAADEFTYYSEGEPPLTNATVRVRDAVSHQVITNGVTDAAGRFWVPELMEGYYDVELDAEQHNGYRGTVFLEAGITNEVRAFLSYQAVRYTWTVERIEIEDRYRITIETTFETVVPAPVVTLDPPLLDVSDLTVVGQTKQVNVKFENHGLIAADDVKWSFSSHPFYSIEPLITDLGRIPAKGSLTIPVTLRRIADFNSLAGLSSGGVAGQSLVTAQTGIPCGMRGDASWGFECGNFRIGGGTAIAVTGVTGDCGGGGWGGGGGGGWGGWGGGGGGGSGGGGVNSSYSSPSIAFKFGCDPKCLILTALGCIPGPIGCFASGFACGAGLGENGITLGTVADCAVGAAGCLIPGAGLPSCLYSLVRCVSSGGGGSGAGGSSPAANLVTRIYSSDGVTGQSGSDDLIDHYKLGVRAMLDAFNELTGAPDGVWFNPAADTATGDWYARFQAAAVEGSAGDRYVTAAEREDLLEGVLPPGVPLAELHRFLDRWNRTLDMIALDISRPADAPPGANLDFIDLVVLKEKMMLAAQYHGEAVAAGFTDPINAIVETARFRSEAESGGVCARVKIKLDQEAVLSREAFKATLEVENGTTEPIEGIAITVRVTDGQGNDRNELFGIDAPELSGLSDVAGGGVVAGGAKGTASWVLVPTVDAAPLTPTEYFVSGEFRYSLNGVVVTMPLSPVAITVNPTARLTLDYFHERDVFSDDPFTDVVEPSIPYNLAIMVKNNGAGEAKNFRITSAQPEIVENEKGLLIDFQIIASEVQGQNLTPSLTVDFGTIPAGGIGVGRWLLTSTLQGLFIDYSATFEHLDSHGNPRTSLIDEVRIHKMNRLVKVNGQHAFLVNDIPNLRDFPDTLWLSDGSSNHVEVITNGVITGVLSPQNLEVQLSAAFPAGWGYLRIPDPGNGQYRLSAVTRADGQTINLENAWVTDRTFRGQGTRPIRENILHLLDMGGPGTYTLVYALVDQTDVTPPVSSVAALPPQSKTAFPVQWSGQDVGSGIANYDIYYSEDGAPFQRWLGGSSAGAALFQGSLGKSYAFYSVATDRAGNREAAPAVPQAQTTIAFSNQPPVLAPIADRIVDAGQTLSLTLAATDPDGDGLSFSLGSGTPPGVVLNPISGALTWVTSPTQGGTTNAITVIARDGGLPQMTSTQTFLVVVKAINHAPLLAPITDVVIPEGQLLTFTNVVTDADLPAQQLTFSLGPNAPAGASITPQDGVFSWRPDETQGGTNYSITIIVTDNGTPALTASQSFQVDVLKVLPSFSVEIGSTAVFSNGAGGVALTLHSRADVTSLRLVLAVQGLLPDDPGSSRLTNFALSGLSPEIGASSLSLLPSNRVEILLGAQPGAFLLGDFTLGQLNFTAHSAPASAVVALTGELLSGERQSGLPGDGAAQSGRVFVIGAEPILDLQRDASNQVQLVLYAVPHRNYLIERTSVASQPAPWVTDALVTPTALRTLLPPRPTTDAAEFFRAMAWGALRIRSVGNSVLVEWPLGCSQCVLEESPQLGAAAHWTRVALPPSEVNGHYQVLLPATGTQRFLRLALPELDPTDLNIQLVGTNVVVEWSLSCANCVLEGTAELGASAQWIPVGVTPTVVNGRYQVILPVSGANRFLRLTQVELDPTDLNIQLVGTNVVVEWSLSCANCVLEGTAELGASAQWIPVGATPTVVNGRYQVILPAGGANRFLRLTPP